MKLAIIHDEIVRRGGAEQVVLDFQKAFPDAPIYTLSYNPKTSYEEFRHSVIKTSWFGHFIKNEDNLKRFFFPFGIWAMQQLDLSGYDVVLQSTTHCSKYIKTGPNTLVITYCHTPFRLVFRPESYESVAQAGFVKRKLYNLVINQLRQIDLKAAQKTHWFLTNSKEVVPRIVSAYNPKREVTVINPSVKCRNFYVSDEVEDYFLVVSRFEPYKKVDLVIEAFKEMPDKKLIIVGKGSRKKELQAMATPNVTFMSGLSAAELAEIFSRCKALIFPQLEDYGITPLEANASGRPVIAYGKGGVLDTMIPVKDDASRATALFFEEQTKESLIQAVKAFDFYEFDPHFIRQHAETFDEQEFIKKIHSYVQTKYTYFFMNRENQLKKEEGAA